MRNLKQSNRKDKVMGRTWVIKESSRFTQSAGLSNSGPGGIYSLGLRPSGEGEWGCQNGKPNPQGCLLVGSNVSHVLGFPLRSSHGALSFSLCLLIPWTPTFWKAPGFNSWTSVFFLSRFAVRVIHLVSQP